MAGRKTAAYFSTMKGKTNYYYLGHTFYTENNNILSRKLECGIECCGAVIFVNGRACPVLESHISATVLRSIRCVVSYVMIIAIAQFICY